MQMVSVSHIYDCIVCYILGHTLGSIIIIAHSTRYFFLKKITTIQLSFLVKLALHLIKENKKPWLAHGPIELHLK